jgi:hypothetical protein
MKSLWKEKSQNIWSFFCPQCKTPRRIPYRSRPGGFKQYAQIGLTSVVVTFATWPWLGAKGIVSFLPIWITFEVLYRSRVRAALNCEQCGFDPILYLSDVKAARREIEDHWKRKFAEKGIPYPDKNQIAAEAAEATRRSASDISVKSMREAPAGGNAIGVKTRLDDPVSGR